MTFRPVSAVDLEALLADLKQSTPDPSVGIFGPASANWKVNRESALFLAAGRTALLQLAHPWVAAAIAQHSRTLNDPVGRFHNTFRVMFTISFGSLDLACEAARRLHRLHETIQGSVPERAGRFDQGTPYHANEIDALTWVFATLVEGALLAYELVLPPLSPPEREQYYAEVRKSAALFGIPPTELPPTFSTFEQYMQSVLQSDTLGVSAPTRQLAHQLRAGTGSPLPVPFWYAALTTQLLPPRFRDEFQLAYTQRERDAAGRALRWIRRVYPHLPAMLRFVGPYNEVQSRLCGRSSPSPLVRLSNRFWVGQPTLLTISERYTYRQEDPV